MAYFDPVVRFAAHSLHSHITFGNTPVMFGPVAVDLDGSESQNADMVIFDI